MDQKYGQKNAKDRGIIITISGLPIKEKNLNVKIQYSERLSQGNLFNLFKECMATNQGSDRVVIDQFTFKQWSLNRAGCHSKGCDVRMFIQGTWL